MLRHRGKYYFMWSEGAGRAPITASPTPSPTRPSGRSNASARSSNKTRRSPAAPGTTPSYRFRGGTNGTSSTTAARWTKRQPAAVKPASTACISMPRAHRSGQDDPRGRRSPPDSRCRQGAVNLSRNREPSTTKIPIRQHCRTGILVPAGTYGERMRRHSPSRSESQRTSEFRNSSLYLKVSFQPQPCPPVG